MDNKLKSKNYIISTVTEINGGAYVNFKIIIQDIAHAKEPKASVHSERPIIL